MIRAADVYFNRSNTSVEDEAMGLSTKPHPYDDRMNGNADVSVTDADKGTFGNAISLSRSALRTTLEPLHQHSHSLPASTQLGSQTQYTPEALADLSSRPPSEKINAAARQGDAATHTPLASPPKRKTLKDILELAEGSSTSRKKPRTATVLGVDLGHY